MKTYSFTPQGVCAKQITFAIDEQGKLHDVRFIGGCPGNLSAIGKLLEGADPKNVAVLLKGNDWPDLCQMTEAVGRNIDKQTGHDVSRHSPSNYGFGRKAVAKYRGWKPGMIPP